jgi:hypothetical protein
MSARLLPAVLVALAVLLASRGGRAGPEDNLLAGLSPSRHEETRRARVLTDGVATETGAGWNTELSALLDSRRAFVEYDLGSVKTLESAFLQADNNDEYVLSVSTDGRSFRELWVAGPVDRPGMRERSTSALGSTGRYLRLVARGGDGSYAVSELQLFSRALSAPPVLETQVAPPTPVRVRHALLRFGLALSVFVLVAGAKLRRLAVLGLALLPLSAAVSLASAIAAAWPLESRELALLRAVVAAVALLAVARERLAARLYPACPAAVKATLVVTALLSAASFYDLGRPQFWNAGESRPEFVHSVDMRIYYPFAKYYDELGYDGVYQASIAAYVEDVPGATLETLRGTEIRDLRTHELERVGSMAPEIERIRERFSPGRWRDFKQDMAFFRAMLGRKGYLTTHSDHGANATPVWVALARPWLAWTPVSERVLVIGGLLDPLLLGLMFAAVGFTFGLRSMLLALTVFGATDLYMFGTNWAGATLRHDWIAYLGLGICALRRERWLLGGALLGLSITIRAFPGVVLVGVGAACAIAFVMRWHVTGRFPSLREHFSMHAPAVRVTVGALVFVAVSVAVTGTLYGFGRWGEWWQKVSLLDSDIGTNDVSLRSLIAFGSDQSPSATLRARWQLYYALWAFSAAVVLAVARRVRPDQAALLALPLIVIVFNPANYYCHFIALLPLLGSDTGARGGPLRGDSPVFSHLGVSGPLLLLCVAEYWTVLDPDLGRHFQLETLFTFAALGGLYVNVARVLWPERPAGELSPEAELAASAQGRVLPMRPAAPRSEPKRLSV